MSSKKKKKPVSGGGGDDDRFLRVQKDPRFWEMPERERKVKIDKRFQSMFHDQRFKIKYTVDKRGRPVNHTSSEDLKRFYKVSDSEDEEEEEEDVSGGKAEKKKKSKVERGGAEPGVRVIEGELVFQNCVSGKLNNRKLRNIPDSVASSKTTKPPNQSV